MFLSLWTMSENIWRVSSTWLRSQNLIFKKSGFRRCIIYTHRELTFSAYGSPCFVGGELWSDYHCKTHKNSTIPKHIQFCLLSFILKVVAKKPDQFGKAMLFPAMVETYAILALLISILAVNAVQI